MFSAWSIQSAIQSFTEIGTFFSFRLIFSGLIFVIGLFISRYLAQKVYSLSEKMISNHKHLVLIEKYAYLFFMLAVLLVALETTGIPLTSFIIYFSVVSIILLILFQPIFINLVSGLYLFYFKPFLSGDRVRIGQYEGLVEQLRLFDTSLITVDNQYLMIPNHQVFKATIINFSKSQQKRLSFCIRLSYADDYAQALQCIHEVIEKSELVLRQPVPQIFIADLAENNISLKINVWSEKEDLEITKGQLLENIKLTFDEQGLSFPYPQRELYLYGDK